MTLEDQAAKNYPGNARYQAAWIRIVQFLGDRWLLKKQIERKPQ